MLRDAAPLRHAIFIVSCHFHAIISFFEITDISDLAFFAEIFSPANIFSCTMIFITPP